MISREKFEAMRRKNAIALALPTWLAAIVGAQAAALQVTPVRVDVSAPAAAATVSLHNIGGRPVALQLRLFKWTQSQGHEALVPTNAVVASPPAAQLAGNQTYVVRIVRTSQKPLTAPEDYRLIIDQLPDARRQGGDSVNMLLRYSIPVFFTGRDARDPQVSWRVINHAGQITAEAVNKGGRELRISNLTVRDRAGHLVRFGNGLQGYVLPHSEMAFRARQRNNRFSVSGAARLAAVTDAAPVHAIASISR